MGTNWSALEGPLNFLIANTSKENRIWWQHQASEEALPRETGAWQGVGWSLHDTGLRPGPRVHTATLAASDMLTTATG